MLEEKTSIILMMEHTCNFGICGTLACAGKKKSCCKKYKESKKNCKNCPKK
jgi:hypothetical protein